MNTVKVTLVSVLAISMASIFSTNVSAEKLKVIDYKSGEFSERLAVKEPIKKRWFNPSAGYRGFGFEQGEQAAFFDTYGGILSSRAKDSRTKERNDFRAD